MSRQPIYLGIDVGTGSARAGFFTAAGRMLSSASCPIQMWRPQADFVEQSSEDIWRACCQAVRRALRQGDIAAEKVAGIGFDATCSLVALDHADRPVSISPTGRDEQNVIVWMDHRAIAQADAINGRGHDVLRYVGGVISPEMQVPKLLWLKKHLPRQWKRAARFFDLPDYLTFRATGDDTRSLCTTVCKWTYLGHRGFEGEGWDDGFFRGIGLAELTENRHARIGRRIRPMGEAVGRGLTERAARELGLPAGTPVAVSIIDAHAGGLGMLGAALAGRKPGPAGMEKRLALIGGTSSCHMAVSTKPRFIRGVWGPYYSAMIPGMWLTEGGQSATGALIDHVIFTHSASITLAAEAETAGRTVYEVLNKRLERLARLQGLRHPAELTRRLHVQPDFHGNRSPRANPHLRGAMAGLTLDGSADDLALKYLATIQSVAHGTRHILRALNDRGYAIDTLFACGGGTKNPVFLREHADVTGCRIVLPREPEAVLLGASILGAVASGNHATLLDAMGAMNRAGRIILPDPGTSTYHDAKHEVFHSMHRDMEKYARQMGEA